MLLVPSSEVRTCFSLLMFWYKRKDKTFLFFRSYVPDVLIWRVYFFYTISAPSNNEHYSVTKTIWCWWNTLRQCERGKATILHLVMIRLFTVMSSSTAKFTVRINNKFDSVNDESRRQIIGSLCIVLVGTHLQARKEPVRRGSKCLVTRAMESYILLFMAPCPGVRPQVRCNPESRMGRWDDASS